MSEALRRSIVSRDPTVKTSRLSSSPRLPELSGNCWWQVSSRVFGVVPVVDTSEDTTRWSLVMPLASRSLREDIDAGPMELEAAVSA